MRSFESNESIHKKEGGYYVVSANKASSVTLQSPGNERQRKHTAILRISNRQSIRSQPGSGLTLAEMSRVRNVLYYGVDFGEMFFLLREAQLGQ